MSCSPQSGPPTAVAGLLGAECEGDMPLSLRCSHGGTQQTAREFARWRNRRCGARSVRRRLPSHLRFWRDLVRLPQPLGCLYFIVLAIGALLLIGALFPFLLIAAVVMFLLGIG